MLMLCFGVFLLFFFFFFFKHIIGYSFEWHRQVYAIQMGTHSICLNKEVDKKCTGFNLKTMELLDCALIGVCVVIRLNTVANTRSYETQHKQKAFITQSDQEFYGSLTK